MAAHRVETDIDSALIALSHQNCTTKLHVHNDIEDDRIIKKSRELAKGNI